ncbi:MAG: hypothetical protein ABI741_01920 [Ferruginibacter sp.]
MFSQSQEEVKRYVDTCMKNLRKNKLNGHIISRFVEKIINELESFNPLNKDAQQWSNIKMAGICFNQVKRKMEELRQQ